MYLSSGERSELANVLFSGEGGGVVVVVVVGILHLFVGAPTDVVW